MRLIDADKFKEWVDAGHLRSPSEQCLSENNVINMIDLQPTAYDVDKVVEQLEERKINREKEYKTASLQEGSYMLSMVFRESTKAYQKSMEIVKAGGKNESN